MVGQDTKIYITKVICNLGSDSYFLKIPSKSFVEIKTKKRQKSKSTSYSISVNKHMHHFEFLLGFSCYLIKRGARVP